MLNWKIRVLSFISYRFEKRGILPRFSRQNGAKCLETKNLQADFIKYEAENKRLKIISIYDSIPAQLNKQNRKFKFTMLNKELKFDRYEDSFLWLKDAGVAIPAYIADVPVSPLEMSRETNVFKLYMSDVGLLTSCYPLAVRKDLLEMNPENEINNGSLFENYVARRYWQMISHRTISRKKMLEKLIL